MADELKKAKAIRVVKQENFTRRRNHLQQLLDGGAASNELKTSYVELTDAFALLEKAHEDVIVAVEDETFLEQEDKYLDEIATLWTEMDVKEAIASDTHDQQRLQEERDKQLAEKKSWQSFYVL